jgi:hypothetical protein
MRIDGCDAPDIGRAGKIHHRVIESGAPGIWGVVVVYSIITFKVPPCTDVSPV